MLIGISRSLVGVLTQPAPAARRAGEPFVVILNAGIIHRVGPNRLHVGLARSLSAAGFEVLRFDLSGLGDSKPRSDCLSALDAGLADIQDVIDWLQSKRGVERIVLVGLCSGADHSVIYSASDPRVVGVALIDPSIPRTAGYLLHHYAIRLLRPRSWLNFLYGRMEAWRKHKRTAREAAEQRSAEDSDPRIDDPKVRAYLSGVYGRALANGVQFFVLLTGGAEGRHNHRRQFLDAYPELRFGEQLTLEYRKGFDHTFSLEASRSALKAMVESWMCHTRFPAAGKAPATGRSCDSSSSESFPR